MKRRISERLRMIWEWLRCPSNRAIRRKLYSHLTTVTGLPLESVRAMAQRVLSRPRHERRFLLKLITADRDFGFLHERQWDEVLSFLN